MKIVQDIIIAGSVAVAAGALIWYASNTDIKMRRVFAPKPSPQPIEVGDIVVIKDNNTLNPINYNNIIIYKNVPYYAQEGKGCCPSPGGSTSVSSSMWYGMSPSVERQGG